MYDIGDPPEETLGEKGKAMPLFAFAPSLVTMDPKSPRCRQAGLEQELVQNLLTHGISKFVEQPSIHSVVRRTETPYLQAQAMLVVAAVKYALDICPVLLRY